MLAMPWVHRFALYEYLLCHACLAILVHACGHWHLKAMSRSHKIHKSAQMTQQQNDPHNHGKESNQLEGGSRQLCSEGDCRFEDATKPNQGRIKSHLGHFRR